MHLHLSDITIEVIQKDIKHLHLGVYPPTGRVRIAAPKHLDADTIRVYAISKLGWIKRQQQKLRRQERDSKKDYISRESHYYLGKRYLLKITEANEVPKVILHHNTIELRVCPGTTQQRRQAILEAWYRKELKQRIQPLIAKWEKVMHVHVAELGIKKMKTKWGTCNEDAKRIWLNLELAKKPTSCIEYILVHEMVHLLERKHNDRFVSYMDRFLPQWRLIKEELNRLPVAHADWEY